MTIKVTVPNTSNDSLTFGSANTPTAAQVIGIDSGSSNGQLAFNTTASGTSTERMRIDASGNVGIGTSSPSKRLQLGNNSVTSEMIRFANTTANFDVGMTTNGCEITTGNNQPIIFTNNAAERARIDSSGNLLVGTTSQISAGKQTTSFSGATLNGLVLSESANTSSSGYILFNNGGSTIGSISRVGATSAVVYSTTSDQRLKSNIENSASVLDKLMQVQVRQFDWTEGDLHQDYGFIAQELASVLSGIVIEGKTEADVWQLDYSRLTPHLVKAIQEQQAQISLQAAVITTLTERISALEAK
jgi:hypothetical protein